MSAGTFEIRPDLKSGLDHLAVESHCSESDLADEEMEAFFVRHAVPMLSDRRAL